MGARALISIEGKSMIATHWDGHPFSLGLDLLNCDKSIKSIIDVAKRHTIDFADYSIVENLNKERIEKLSREYNLSKDDIEGGIGREVIAVEDYGIDDINIYGDWAQFQYDIRDGQVFFRSLSGFYPDSLRNASDFKLLTQERGEASREKRNEGMQTEETNMNRYLYLVGQITANRETYIWRSWVSDYFKNDEQIEVIDPCNNKFSKEMLEIALSANTEFRAITTWNKYSNILTSRDLDSVLMSDIGLANLNIYDPEHPFIGSFFELCCYYMNPEKTVIGIFDGNPEEDSICCHPFIRQTVDVWTKNVRQACELIDSFFKEGS